MGPRRAARARTTSTSRSCRCWSTSCCSRPRGSSHYTPYRVAGLLVHAFVVVLLFLYARRRVGDLLALAAAAVVACSGRRWPDVLWPFQTGFLGVAGGGARRAARARPRRPPRRRRSPRSLLTRRARVLVARHPALAAAALEVLGRPDRRRRWRVLVAPGRALRRLVPRLRRRGQRRASTTSLARPPTCAEAAAGGAGAVFGLGSSGGGRSLLAARRAARARAPPRAARPLAAGRADRAAAAVLGADRARARRPARARPRRATSTPARSSCC